jgi:hypothetical protein
LRLEEELKRFKAISESQMQVRPASAMCSRRCTLHNMLLQSSEAEEEAITNRLLQKLRSAQVT